MQSLLISAIIYVPLIVGLVIRQRRLAQATRANGGVRVRTLPVPKGLKAAATAYIVIAAACQAVTVALTVLLYLPALR